MEPVRIEELALLKCMKGLHILQSERGLIFFFSSKRNEFNHWKVLISVYV